MFLNCTIEDYFEGIIQGNVSFPEMTPYGYNNKNKKDDGEKRQRRSSC